MRFMNPASAILGILLFVSSSVAYADGIGFDADPVEIADACMARVTEAADHCVAANEAAADACSAMITAILAKGQDRRAQRVADNCIRRINRHSDRCVAVIQYGCDACVAILGFLEADQGLIDEVEAHCAAEIARVEDSQAAAVAAVEAALNP